MLGLKLKGSVYSLCSHAHGAVLPTPPSAGSESIFQCGYALKSIIQASPSQFPSLYQGSAGICQWICVSAVWQPVWEDGWEHRDLSGPGKVEDLSALVCFFPLISLCVLVVCKNAVFKKVSGRLMAGMMNGRNSFLRHVLGKHTEINSRKQNEIRFSPSPEVVWTARLYTCAHTKTPEIQFD